MEIYFINTKGKIKILSKIIFELLVDFFFLGMLRRGLNLYLEFCCLRQLILCLDHFVDLFLVPSNAFVFCFMLCETDDLF